MQKILCVEDAPDVIAVLDVVLGRHHLSFARSLAEAREALAKDRYSLILLDIELPDGSGFEIMSVLADRIQGTPVIFVTGRQNFASKATAFSLGAEDFIVKPFDPEELRLRVESKLRKVASQQEERSLFRVGTLTCNVQEQRLFAKGSTTPIDLTSLEFRIFHLMAQAPNKVFSRSEILDRVWGTGTYVTDRAVDVHVSNLRKHLNGTGVAIEAVIGRGYRLHLEKEV